MRSMRIKLGVVVMAGSVLALAGIGVGDGVDVQRLDFLE